jgi:DNA-binding NtrC family response regulator
MVHNFEQTPLITEQGGGEKTILVVDDDENIGIIIIELIHQETPHKSLRHVTGTQAIQALRNHIAHLFILDYELPDMSGLQLHDQLHTFDHLSNVPTLLISAKKPPMYELRKRTITFLAKPFDLTKLLQIISILLS